jgi:hypothetical protein
MFATMSYIPTAKPPFQPIVPVLQQPMPHSESAINISRDHTSF